MTFKKVITDHIKKAICAFRRERSFSSLDANNKLYLFHQTIKNILSNLFPHTTIISDDTGPPWINLIFEQLVNEKNVVYKNYKNSLFFELFHFLQN